MDFFECKSKLLFLSKNNFVPFYANIIKQNKINNRYNFAINHNNAHYKTIIIYTIYIKIKTKKQKIFVC